MSPITPLDLLVWLSRAAAAYEFDVVALYSSGGEHDWPLSGENADDLVDQLSMGGHLLPLPKEPAALANILEVSIVDFLLRQAEAEDGLDATRGTERGYPDVEVTGPAVDGKFYAVDVKVARRASGGNRTQSRITLYTGNTYFRYPSLHWPGTFRPFADYEQHLDVLGIYTLDEEGTTRVSDLELIVQEPWRIASRQRSSTTREYLGAVNNLAALREGRGEFDSPDEFYRFWRRFPFRIGRTVQQQLDRLLAEQQ